MDVFGHTPALCGHRGAGAGPGENTLGAFRAAVAAGVDWVEVDVRLSADGVLVAHHDPTLRDGRPIAGLTAAESGCLRAAELLAELPGHVAVDFDVKSALEDAVRPRAETTAGRLADLAAAAGRRVLVTSFDAGGLAIVRERAPELPLGLLTLKGMPLREAVPAAAHLGVEVLAPEVGALMREPELARCLDVAHAAGLQVAAWCPRPEEADALLEAGVDCLIVDDLTRAAPAALAARRSRG